MSSPRSMWSGAIRLGLLNVPCTIGKAWSEEREKSLRDLCADHLLPVDRSERCSANPACTLTAGKVKGVDTERGWRALRPDEYAAIENATKLETLDVLDCQPLDLLLVNNSIGVYYIRHDKKAKGSEQVFALLAEALRLSKMGLVCKWGNSSKQKLVVISANSQGIIRMHHLPFASELRDPGEQETAHQSTPVEPQQVAMLVDLFSATANAKGFDYAAYEDDGLRVRQDAVEAILAGNGSPTPPAKPKGTNDLMAALAASVDRAKTAS